MYIFLAKLSSLWGYGIGTHESHGLNPSNFIVFAYFNSASASSLYLSIYLSIIVFPLGLLGLGAPSGNSSSSFCSSNFYNIKFLIYVDNSRYLGFICGIYPFSVLITVFSFSDLKRVANLGFYLVWFLII